VIDSEKDLSIVPFAMQGDPLKNGPKQAQKVWPRIQFFLEGSQCVMQ